MNDKNKYVYDEITDTIARALWAFHQDTRLICYIGKIIFSISTNNTFTYIVRYINNNKFCNIKYL